jgi:hypothetical protein
MRSSLDGTIRIVALAGLLAVVSAPGLTQELEPRRWTHLPIDRNFLASGYAHTDGEVALDPVLQIEDAKVAMDTWTVGYIRSFELFGKSARAEIRQAWQDGRWSGRLSGAPAAVERQGLADTIARFAVNLWGAPPLDGKAYAAYRARTDVETIAGAALVLELPTGEYKNDKLINLGNNRFTFQPQLGFVHNRRDWSFEVTAVALIYTDNTSFLIDNRLERAPLYSLQTHVVHTFPSRFWVAGSAGFALGGRTSVNGAENDDDREDVLWAVSAGYPIAPWLGIKFVYLDSHRRNDVGNESESFGVALQTFW